MRVEIFSSQDDSQLARDINDFLGEEPDVKFITQSESDGPQGFSKSISIFYEYK